MDLLQLYWDNPTQLSQGVWALQPNIDTVDTQLLNVAWKYMQTPKH